MKKIRILSILIIFALLLCSKAVFAESSVFSLEMHPSSTEIKRGETLYLEIICKNTGGNSMQGIESDFIFDGTVFELQKNDALSPTEDSTDFKAYTESRILKSRGKNFNYSCK